ncbi:zinc finger domain-containing protein [Sorangium sp. So ce269]
MACSRASGTQRTKCSSPSWKLRDFLKVRGRPGQPCPRCGDKLRRASVHGYDAIFCPSCQPEDRKSAAVNARRTR